MRLLWLVQWLVARMPVWLGFFIGDRGGDIAYYLARRSRCYAESNMRHVLPLGTPDKVVRAAVHGVFRNLGRNYYDLLRAHSLSEAQLDHFVTFDEASFAPVRALAAAGKGFILVSAHFGAFDTVSTVMARRGLPLLLIVARTKPYVVSDFLTRLRTERDLTEINLDDGLGAIKRALQGLRRGETVALFADRNMEPTGIKIPFFGADAIVAAGMAKMALRSKVPVVPAFCHRHGRHYVLKFEPPVYPPVGGDETQNLQQFTRNVFKAYEKHIAIHPEQWVLLQPVWRDAACDDADAPAAVAA